MDGTDHTGIMLVITGTMTITQDTLLISQSVMDGMAISLVTGIIMIHIITVGDMAATTTIIISMGIPTTIITTITIETPKTIDTVPEVAV